MAWHDNDSMQQQFSRAKNSVHAGLHGTHQSQQISSFYHPWPFKGVHLLQTRTDGWTGPKHRVVKQASKQASEQAASVASGTVGIVGIGMAGKLWKGFTCV
jgi:hypothetical protein